MAQPLYKFVNKESASETMDFVKMYSAEYCHNGVSYLINDSFEIHTKLATDQNYLIEYINQNVNKNPIEELPEEECTLQNPSNLHLVEDEAPTPQNPNNLHLVEDEAPTPQNPNNLHLVEDEAPTPQNPSNFIWNRKNTKLLLLSYKERVLQFRNPRIKKKQIWAEIVNEFQNHGINVDVDMLDRKMRNMKKTYRTIKDNNNQSGRGRINWEYYEIFEDLFIEERTVNFGPTISSCTPAPPHNEALVERHNDAISIESTQYINIHYRHMHLSVFTVNDRYHVARTVKFTRIHSHTCAHPTSSMPRQPQLCMSNTYELSGSRNTFNGNDSNLDIGDIGTYSTPSSSASQRPLEVNIVNDPRPSTSNEHRKENTRSSSRNRSLYSLRKRQLEIEEKRVEAIKVLSEKIDQSNRIQEERNKLLEILIRQRSNDN